MSSPEVMAFSAGSAGMAFQNSTILVQTSAKTDVIDITQDVLSEVAKASFEEGVLTLFIPGSTAALTTIEYESGAVQDLKEAIERMVPEDRYYKHNERWGDGNGYSHVRAAMIGPSLQIPVIKGTVTLGTWQQIVLLDFDNQPRRRRIVLQIWGE